MRARGGMSCGYKKLEVSLGFLVELSCWSVLLCPVSSGSGEDALHCLESVTEDPRMFCLNLISFRVLCVTLCTWRLCVVECVVFLFFSRVLSVNLRGCTALHFNTIPLSKKKITQQPSTTVNHMSTPVLLSFTCHPCAEPAVSTRFHLIRSFLSARISNIKK